MQQRSMFGRLGTVSQILETLDCPRSAIYTVIVGPAGIGRTALLDEVARAAVGRGLPVLRLRLVGQLRLFPFFLVSRLIEKLNELAVALPAEVTGKTPHAAQPATDETGQLGAANVRHVAAILARKMLAHPGLVVLVDDVHWIDEQSLAALEQAAHLLAESTVRCVFTTRVPTRVDPMIAGRALLRRLSAAGLARSITLRPLSLHDSGATLAEMTSADPHPVLNATLHRRSGGIPAAIHAGIDGYSRSGWLRVVDHHAYLINPGSPPELPTDSGLLAPIRELAAPAFAVAKAVAVLLPLGDQVPRLAGVALDLDAARITEVLNMLVSAAIVRVGRHNGHWSFRVPLMADALISCLGPYERRRLAQAAVTALWAGTACSDDRAYIADQLVNAGRMVDAHRASTELTEHGHAAMLRDSRSAARWLGAAADLMTDRRQRANILLARTSALYLHADFAGTLRAITTLLDQYADVLTPDGRQELELLHAVSLRSVGELDPLEQAATGGGLLPQGSVTAVTRATALILLDRWGEARDLLAVRSEPTVKGEEEAGTGKRAGGSGHGEAGGERGAAGGAFTADLQAITRHCIEAIAGRAGDPGRSIGWDRARRPHEAGRHCAVRIRAEAGTLLLLGDANRAEALLARGRFWVPDVSEVTEVERALLAWQRGRWDEALDLARIVTAQDGMLDCRPSRNALHPAVAMILLDRGRPIGAKAVLSLAREQRPLFAHLYDLAEASIEATLGSPVRAAELAGRGLEYALERSILPGTDRLWLVRGWLALRRGDLGQAREAMDGTARAARLMQTESSRLAHLVLRVMVEHDRGAAQEAMALARDLGQPFELACTLISVVVAGCGSPALLHESYDLLGDLDALLPRYHLRRLMRECDLTVRDRNRTVAENQRLLAVLVSEGLTNGQLAMVLRASHKGVESMLSRLFARTGHRSRVGLASTILGAGYGTG